LNDRAVKRPEVLEAKDFAKAPLGRIKPENTG
jgi:hypothetical protein